MPRLLAATLGALTALALTLAAPASSATPKTFFGVVPQATPTAAGFQQLGDGKVGTMRIGIFWSTVDPVAPTGDYDFSTIDPVVGGAAQQGIEVLPYLYGTPEWVAKGLDNANCASECGTFAPKSQAALDAWSAFVAAAVARYGPNGAFWSENPSIPKRPITAWQLWNEPNSDVFYAPKADPKAYAKLLGAGSDAVKSEDSRADVVLGGMPQLAGSRKATPGTKYLRALYRVKGVEKDFDGVAVHPYGAKVKAVIEQVEGFRSEIKRARDKSATLWITETGWGSEKGGNPLNVGTKGQASRLKEAFSYFEKNRKKLKIATINWYSLMDNEVAVCDWCGTSGLFTLGGEEKPSWKAFTKFTGGR